MKIAIDVQPTLHQKAGISRYIEGLIKGLDETDSDNEYLLNYFDFRKRGCPVETSRNNFKHNSFKWIPGRLAGRYWRYLNWPGYDSFFGSADIFHFTNFLIRPVLKGKSVATVHDMSFVRFPQFTEPKNLDFLSKRIEKTLTNADEIITDSYYSREEIVNCYSVPNKKVHAVHLGVDERFYLKWEREELEKLKKRYNLPNRFILFLGTLEPRKNILGIIDSFLIFREKSGLKDINLVLSGSMGWLSENLNERISELKNKVEGVFHIGYVNENDIPGLYRASEAFIFPSFYEGFGLPPLEAMASSIPVISSRKGSLNEVLGNAPLYVDPENHEQIADAISEVLQNDEKRSELIENGLKQASSFTWKKTAKETLEVYELVNGKRNHQ